MGSFNETCAVSGIHIRSSDEVAVMLLQRPQFSDNHGAGCYTTDYADIAPLMFYGKYDDYGSVEEVQETTSFKILLQQVKRRIPDPSTELPPNLSDYEKKRLQPPDRESFDLSTLLSSCWEGTMFQDEIEPGNGLRFALIDKVVLDKILSNYRIKEYRRDGYISYGFKRLLNDVNAYVRRYQSLHFETSFLDPMAAMMMRMRSNDRLELFKVGEPVNYASKFLHYGYNQGPRAVFNPLNYLSDNPDVHTYEELKEFVTELLKVQFLNHFMHNINKNWQKPMSSGQDSEWKGHMLLQAAVLEKKAIEEEEDRAYLAEDGQDDDEESAVQDIDDIQITEARAY